MIRRLVLALMLAGISANAGELNLQGVDRISILSPEFVKAIAEANHGGPRIQALELLYAKCTRPEEQAEIELTLARIYNQQFHFVDYAKAIQWYDKALVRDLPPKTLATQFILRGNSHESLGHLREALNDYIRGFLACARFNLPEKWPSRQGTGKLSPPALNKFLFDKQAEAAERQGDQSQYADFWRDYQETVDEQEILMKRYFYVDAVKRIAERDKLSESQLREIAEKLTNRQERVEELLRRVREPNPQPWP
jgi:tetratricopeptide (TPR) repeat protein